ncbi:MAG: DMT family transporter [Bacteroidetes bacterium]|nr:DMT family transporter [Fibrella sp.]
MTTTATVPESAIASKRPLMAWLLLVALALVWGSSFILIKRSLVSFLPEQVAAGRLLFGLLFFSPFLVQQSRSVEIRTLVGLRWKAFVAIALIGFVIPAFIFAVAGAHLNSSLAGALNSLSPLFTMIVGALFFGNPLRLRQTTGIVLGLVGSMLLVFFSASGEFAVNGYALLIVLATLCYGLNINLISRYVSDLSALVSSAWIFAVAGSLSLLILLTSDFFGRVTRPEGLPALLALITLGVVGSGLMSIVFNRVVQLASPLFASSVTYLIPIVALLWGFLDGERIYAAQYLGMAVCLAGVYLVNRK